MIFLSFTIITSILIRGNPLVLNDLHSLVFRKSKEKNAVMATTIKCVSTRCQSTSDTENRVHIKQ